MILISFLWIIYDIIRNKKKKAEKAKGVKVLGVVTQNSEQRNNNYGK